MVTMAEATGIADVRGVEPPAQPDLQHRHVHPARGEVQEGRGGHRLEVGRVRRNAPGAHQRLRRVAHTQHRALERARGDLAAVDHDPLVQAHQVRRRVAAHREPGVAQRLVHDGHDRALAVRAGHQQRRPRAAPDDRAPPSARASCPGRTSCRSARARRGIAGRSSSPAHSASDRRSWGRVWKSGRKCGILLARCVQRDLSPPNRPQGAAPGPRGLPPGPRGAGLRRPGGDAARPVPRLLPAPRVGAARGPARTRCPRSAGPSRRSRAAGQPRRRLRARRAGPHPAAGRPARGRGPRARTCWSSACSNRFEVWAPDAWSEFVRGVGAAARGRLARTSSGRCPHPPAAAPADAVRPQAKPKR